MRAITQATATTGIDQLHRVMLVKVLRPNGTAPVLTDILQANTITAGRNRAKMGDYVVLFDKVLTINDSDESGSKRFIKYYKRLWMPVVYNSGNAGTIADIQKNALYLLVLGSVATGATAG